MMKGFHSFFGSRWKFQRADLEESSQALRDPERGWYQVHNFSADKGFSREELEWILRGEDVLALALIDIGAYRERALDQAGLNCISGILDCFVEAGLDVILRIAYDHEGKAMEREPLAFRQVEEHMVQLGPLLAKYAEHIFVYQGLLVGSWGEMHSSRFLITSQLSRLAVELEKNLGTRSFLAVRRPMYWRALNPWAEGKEDYSRTRMGLFDDGILGSDTHLGTFGTMPRREAGWEKAWTAEEELTFEEKLCRYAPQGGEAIYEEGASEKRSLEETVKRLRRLQLSYLNRVHDGRLLELWKGMTWKEKGPWSGVNGYDYIGRHLGYRFCVRSVKVNLPKGDQERCQWEIAVENTGFARCYQETKVWLEWTDSRGEICTETISLDLGGILPGEMRTVTCTTAPAEGEIRLRAARKSDGRAIGFANVPAGGTGVLLGRLVQS